MIKEMEITIPDTRTMERFADLSQRLFDKIKENQSQIGILKKLSDTLLPKLISGEVRVQL